MTWQYVPWVIPIVVAAGFSCALTVFAWHRRSAPLAWTFTLMMAGVTLWAAGAALESSLVELSWKRLCIDLRLLGTYVAILSLLAFVLRYAGLGRWLRAGRFGLVCAPAVFLLLLEWTSPWHQLFWTDLANETIEGVQIARRGFGPGFWASVGYCYVLTTVATVLLGRTAVRFSGLYRAQAVLMLCGVLLPWLVDVADMRGLFGFIPVDMVSISFTVMGLTFLPAIIRFRLLDLTPVAWAAVVELMEDPVFVMDYRGRVVASNPAAQRLAGRFDTAILGVDAAEACASWPELAARLRRFEEIREETFEVDRVVSDGTLVYSARVSRLALGPGPSGWTLVLREITELHSAKRERAAMLSVQKAFAESEAANRAKDHFIATLSHELRTPLTPILSTVTAMLDDPSTRSSLRPVLEMIRRNTALEARLIDDLLDLTRIEQGKLHLIREVIDAHEQIDQVIELCADEAYVANVTLISQLKADHHHIDADPARFHQILWNLLKNAIKFSSPGGPVTIRSRNRAGTPSSSALPWLEVQVVDRGIGIEPDLLEMIFDPFVQGGQASCPRSGGLGLGLAISRSITEQHGGSLSASSAGWGTGSTFTLEIPTVAPSAAPRAPHPIARDLVKTRRALRILLVEDNKDTLKYLSESLIKQGHQVQTASDLAQALRAAADTDFEMLISDIELPDGSGIELMWKLRSRRDVMGIAVSGFGTTEDVIQSKSAGFAWHLTKPFEFRKLEEAIEQVVAAHQHD